MALNVYIHQRLLRRTSNYVKSWFLANETNPVFLPVPVKILSSWTKPGMSMKPQGTILKLRK